MVDWPPSPTGETRRIATLQYASAKLATHEQLKPLLVSSRREVSTRDTTYYRNEAYDSFSQTRIECNAAAVFQFITCLYRPLHDNATLLVAPSNTFRFISLDMIATHLDYLVLARFIRDKDPALVLDDQILDH